VIDERYRDCQDHSRRGEGVSTEGGAGFFLLIEWETLEDHLKWRDSTLEGREWFKSNVRPLMSGTNLTGHFIPYAQA
jgi:heme-degrading monooxygenase HmoA